MKLHFEPDLDYQLEAMEAACDLFKGQEVCRSEFTVVRQPDDVQERLSFARHDIGIGNKLQLLDDQILENLHEVQLRNGLPPSEKLEGGDFTIEMETGTGKTYVYLRTAFELNKRYGFTKFVIVVPSVAIKEGVFKTLHITEDHFRSLYAGVPFDYFIYDSAKLGQVRNFATSPHLQFMIVTVGAINKFGDEAEAAAEEADQEKARQKSRNVMYRHSEKTGGEKPIDLIRSTTPILIVDEPQSVEGGLDGKGKRAMARMNPLCNLRYSATPKHAHHMIFKLNAIEAYERRLVKQIEVASGGVEGDWGTPYIKLLKTESRKGTGVAALVELHVTTGKKMTVKELRVRDGDMLDQITGRDVYADCRIGEISATKGNAFMEIRLPGVNKFLRLGESHGGIDPADLPRQMIRKTIQEHLEKELRLAPLGIKVLSLFFIDKVENYRRHDPEGNPLPGPYATIFEEEYLRLLQQPKYQSLFQQVDLRSAARDVHEGYFSIDRKKVGGKTVELLKDTGGNTAADEDTYALIMRDKERLLSLETPLKFIFSHSALREGWDNPNVFQICVLRDMGTEQQRRQSIGRGLRLCVNQEGERQRSQSVNTLTVIAMESYEDFAEALQKEIEEETGIRFGMLENHHFSTILVKATDGSKAEALGFERSKELWEAFRAIGYVNASGKVQDTLRRALRDDTVEIPPAFRQHQSQIEGILRRVAGKLDIKDASKRQTVATRMAVLEGPEFTALWDRIKHKTSYRVAFDNRALITECTSAVARQVEVARARLVWRSADVSIGRGGIEATETKVSGPIVLETASAPLPDILTELQNRTQLTRKSVLRILKDSGKLNEFKRNPQEFIDQTAEVINRTKRLALVDGVKYQKIGQACYYAQELFGMTELQGYLSNMVKATKSVHEYVVYDSEVEATFAEQLEKNTAVKVYAKLPRRFTVPTPLGPYNPDWAVLVETDGSERLYFVVETKGSLFDDEFRNKEKGKILCGKKHFETISVGENPARYVVARNLDDVLKKVAE